MSNAANLFIQRFWTDGLDKRLPVLVTLLALVLLTHSMATLTWKLVPAPEFADQKISSPSGNNGNQRSPGAQTNKAQANKISSWHLFGKYEKPKKAAPAPIQTVEAAPDTKLNLKLRGVFASPNQKMSRAIIADAKGKEDSYAVGRGLPGGAILNKIFSDKVILEYQGRLETLRLPIQGEEGSSSRSNRASTSKSRKSSRASSRPISSSGDNSAVLKQYRDALLNDPQSVMGLIRAEPYQKDGELKGYRIRPGKDRQLLRKFGLRSGDIVTSVNGVPMTNPIKALEVLRDLSSASQLSVEVERRGVPKSFNFSIDN